LLRLTHHVLRWWPYTRPVGRQAGRAPRLNKSLKQVSRQHNWCVNRALEYRQSLHARQIGFNAIVKHVCRRKAGGVGGQGLWGGGGQGVRSVHIIHTPPPAARRCQPAANRRQFSQGFRPCRDPPWIYLGLNSISRPANSLE
jgi:hypothetical protein